MIDEIIDYLETFRRYHHDVSLTFAPLAVLISAYLISNFFTRFANCYRRKYITARQTVTKLSLITTSFPVVLILLCCLFSTQHSVFGFALICSLLCVFYPLLAGQKIIAMSSLFPFSLFFSALISIHPSAIYLFSIAIIPGLYKFDGEDDHLIWIYRRVVTPFLLTVFIGLLMDDLYISRIQTLYISGFIGSFLGLLF